MLLSSIRTSAVFLLLFTLLLCGAYPGVSTLFIQGLFPHEAEGSLIKDKDGKILGSELIGQNFTQPKYFWGRLSAASYNAASSSGSNWGVNNPKLLDAAKARIQALHDADPSNTKPVPVDLITASGSGLDPHISIAAAEYQIGRVAKTRGLDEAQVKKLIEKHTAGRQFGFLGELVVNVLSLNLDLDNRLPPDGQ